MTEGKEAQVDREEAQETDRCLKHEVMKHPCKTAQELRAEQPQLFGSVTASTP